MKYYLQFVLLLSIISCISFAQWTQTNGPEGGVVLSLTTNQSNGHIFAGTKGGVYRSTDDGVTWTWVNTGLPANIQITSMHSSGSDTYIFDGSTAILYYSNNEGGSWTTTTGTGFPLIGVIGQMVTANGKLFATIVGFNDQGVFVTTDHGTSWTKSSTGLPSTFKPGTIALIGSNLFTGANLTSSPQGVYMSSDYGANWTSVSTGFATSGGTTAITNIGSTIFASTLTAGVYASSNNGGSWSKISPTTPVLILGASALAATSTNLFIGTGAIYKANSSGGSWDTVTTGLPARNAGTAINALTVNGSTVIAAFHNLGLYRTTNAGANWSKCNTGLFNGNVDGIYVNGSKLYAGGETTGFFLSENNGDTWTAINNGLDLRDNGYFGFITSGSYLLGGGGLNGMFRSSDGGNTWVPGSLPKPAYGFIKDGGDVYAAITGDVMKSTDDGATWTSMGVGVPYYIAILSVWKYDSVMLAGASAGGLKRSTNNGATWTAPISGAPTIGAYGYNAFCQIDTTLFVAHQGGVYRSTDHGATWASVSTGLTGVYPTTIHKHGSFLFVGTNNGVYKSSNQGTSWSTINTGFPSMIKINVLTSNDGYLFAGTGPNSVWRVPINQVTAVREVNDAVPTHFVLEQNYPNPFNPTTNFRFQILDYGLVTLRVFDVVGREVATVVNDNLHPGTYTATWDASGQPSGVYYYRLLSGAGSEIKKMVLTK